MSKKKGKYKVFVKISNDGDYEFGVTGQAPPGGLTDFQPAINECASKILTIMQEIEKKV